MFGWRLGDILGGDGCGELVEEPLAPQARGGFGSLYVAEFGIGCGERAEQALTVALAAEDDLAGCAAGGHVDKHVGP